jgi:flagellin-like protein
MKGISTVIATLMMLLITMALAGMAYMYISGVFTAQTQGIEVVDAYCVKDQTYNAHVRIRNIGTRNINVADILCTRTLPTPGDCTFNREIDVLVPGNATKITIECPIPNTPGNCVYRLTPPAGRSVEVSVAC